MTVSVSEWVVNVVEHVGSSRWWVSHWVLLGESWRVLILCVVDGDWECTWPQGPRDRRGSEWEWSPRGESGGSIIISIIISINISINSSTNSSTVVRWTRGRRVTWSRCRVHSRPGRLFGEHVRVEKRTRHCTSWSSWVPHCISLQRRTGPLVSGSHPSKSLASTLHFRCQINKASFHTCTENSLCSGSLCSIVLSCV